MEKAEILNKFKEFMDKGEYVRDAFPDILEKHGAADIASGFADKLDTIADPFERLLVGVHVADRINEIDREREMAIEMGLAKESPSYSLGVVYPGNSTLATFQNSDMDSEEQELCKRHKEMVEVSLYANSGQYEKAEEAFERYIVRMHNPSYPT